MKMKKIWVALLLAGMSFGMGSCMKEDIDDIRKELQEHDDRLTSLEEWQKSVNTNISSLQSLVEALEDKDYVTGVTPLADGSGYEISFLKSGKITIKNGEKGEKGEAGNTPVISVKQDTDKKYYWTVNGEWLLDGGNNKMPVTGEKGDKGDTGNDGLTPHIGDNGNWWVGTTDTGVKAQGNTGDDGLIPHIGDNGNWWIGTTDTGVKAQGEQGDPGTSAIAPQVRINTENEWEISTDGGKTWVSTGVMATGEKGDDGDSFFKNVTVFEEKGYVSIELKDGQTFQIPLSQNRLTFALDGTTLTDLTRIIDISQGDLTYTVVGNGTVSVRILEGSGWSAEVVDPEIRITGKLGESALLELTLLDNGKVLETYRLNLTQTSFMGEGTLNKPYIISSAEELCFLAKQVNNGTAYTNQYFQLDKDIDLSGEEMEPIGTVRTGAVAIGKAFQGIFDGNSHVLSNLEMSTTDEKLAQGLFGYNKGVIKNLILENVTVKGYESQGALVGDNRGTVENCHVRGTVTVEGSNNIGGLVGNNYGSSSAPATVTGCSVSGNVTVKGTGVTVGIGGVIGYNVTGKVTACRFQGKLAVSGGSSGSMGGVVGYNSTVMKVDESAIIACYANCEFESHPTFTGGVVGTHDKYGSSKLTACYSIVASSKDIVGGVCAATGEFINACFWEKSGVDNYPQHGIHNSFDDYYNPEKTSDENAMQVTEDSWSEAMEKMNAALSGTGWQYKENTGSDKTVFPLIVEKVQ